MLRDVRAGVPIMCHCHPNGVGMLCHSPSLMPPGVKAFLSPGQVFLLVEMLTNSSKCSTIAPSTPCRHTPNDNKL